MDWRYQAVIQALDRAILSGSGRARQDLRRTAEATAARAAGVNRAGAGLLPPELQDFIAKVAKHAYKVVDEDFDAMKAAGYDEDQIFELTVAAALGSGLSRLERGLVALRTVEVPQ